MSNTFDRLWELAHAINRVDEAERELSTAVANLLDRAGWELDPSGSGWRDPSGTRFSAADARNVVMTAWKSLCHTRTPKPEEQEVASE